MSSDKIGRLMDLVGELSLSVSETINSPELADLDLMGFEAAAHRLSMIVREVQDAATELRLVPVGEVFRRLKRMIRELERETGKKIELVIKGDETAIDKLVADRLYDPLLHVVRNAADHGLEATTADRVAVGKSESGKITLAAAQVGSEVRIQVIDDGRGLNRDRILKKARERGLFGPEEEPENSAVWKVIFEPGFSTAEAVTTLSGRGVGMDVLNQTMKDLRGRIAVDSNPGEGTAVSLHIPVSLAFLDSILLRLGEKLFTVPVDDIQEIVKPGGSDTVSISADHDTEMLKLRGVFVPVCRLERFYRGMRQELKPLSQMVAIIFNTANGAIAVPVDEVLDRQQVVMKPLTGALSSVRASWGCALLPSGEVAIVLDCERLALESAR
ncbi:chemotaxis protein CheA [Pseudoprimorskyibacter insulae]|uniref:chemotaxis protein CheA n=1 Tax=Pseudoprimorskyibacter insulae TaxID=1695997 RepID=UPI001FE38F9B|nr:chemotaxis protein CheW [Pseudoprimorskyibacter insulae]